MEYAIETLEIELEHCKSGYKESTDPNLKSIYSQQVLEIVRALKMLKLNPPTVNNMETITPQTETKAIKEHKCNFCNLKINKGSIYLKAVYKYDDIYTWKSHTHCQQIADKLAMIDYCDEGITDDDFREYINNEFNELFNHNLNSFEERLELVLNHHGLTHNSKIT